MGKTESVKALDTLVAALGDQDEAVQRSAAQALRRIGSDKGVDALIPLMSHTSESVRYEVSLALAEIGSPRAEDVLIEALQDDYHDVRWHAVDGLGAIQSSRAVRSLVEVLRDSDKTLRRAAAKALGMIGSAQAVDPLIAALTDEDYHMRHAAVEALGAVGSDRASDTLLGIVCSHGGDISEAEAAVVRGEYPDPAMASWMVHHAGRESSELGQAAGEALAKIGSDRVVDALIEIQRQRSNDDGVGLNAYRALSMIHTEYATHALHDVAQAGCDWAGHLLEKRCRERGVTILGDGRAVELSQIRLHEELRPE